MIIAEQKPLDEIKAMLKGSNKVLAVGCGTCVTVCFAGGRQEVGVLSASLRMSTDLDGHAIAVDEAMVQRQCEEEFIAPLEKDLTEYDAILSLGCGVGVQSLAQQFPDKQVMPALDTKFMGYPSEHGVWEERCQGCGSCVLHLTGGICPVSRCSKSLLNGPCGGSQSGICETDPDTECAWHTICERQIDLGLFDEMMKIHPAKDWSTARDGGHRRIVREDVRLPDVEKGFGRNKQGNSVARNYPAFRMPENKHAPPFGERCDSNLARVLAAGEFAVTGEIGPPKGHDAEVVRTKTRLLTDCVDAANVTDNQTAVVRMSSIAAGLIMMQEGIEPIIQMTCRDRNRLAMQSDLLGAYALGIKNLLCLSGDHQSGGNHPGAKNVHDIDSMLFIRMMKDMRDQNRFQCGEEIKDGGPRYLIGGAANPFADPAEWRPYRLAKKALSGADFVQTQLVYDIPRFREYMKQVVDMGVAEQLKVIAGVGPLKSTGMAKYMRDRVPGMTVPDELVERMDGAVAGIDKEKKAERSAAWRSEGIGVCIEQIQETREIDGVAGVHIMGIEWEESIRPIAEGAGLLPRPVLKV